MSCPPGTCGSSTSVDRPRRAANRPAVRPAIPPPITTRSWSRLPPLVDRGGLVVARPEDPPVAVRLAAHDDDLDLLPPEHRDQLVVLRLELGRVRLLAEGRAWVDVVLDKLVVPVLPGRHRRGLVDPVDQLLLVVEAAAADE